MEPERQIRWTRTALRALDGIASYIARDKPADAQRFVSMLRDGIERLRTFPELGRIGRVTGTRELVLHRNYLAIYRVQDAHIDILRIQHVARRSGGL